MPWHCIGTRWRGLATAALTDRFGCGWTARVRMRMDEFMN